ncbi:MAG: threonine/serine dehydratase [Gammaproteobacteria bacterium]
MTNATVKQSMQIPLLADIKHNRERISKWIVQTPVWQNRSWKLQQIAGPNTELFFKLELLQHGGSFKPRGALVSLLNLSSEASERGVVAASAGNHGIGVSYAANVLGISAKIIMPRTVSPLRLERCKAYDAEVILVDTLKDAFDKMQEISVAEQRAIIHPFEGPSVALGTAGIGLELVEQIPQLDAVVVPIGGGGLCGGIAAAVKQLLPQCQIFGVEPEGADAMYRSFQAGKPQSIEKPDTIADSLGAPYTLPYCYFLCKTFVDDVVLVSDAALRQAMRLLQEEMKLAVEPAAAAPTAAWSGPLRERLQGKRVALIISGTNIDSERFCNLLRQT